MIVHRYKAEACAAASWNLAGRDRTYGVIGVLKNIGLDAIHADSATGFHMSNPRTCIRGDNLPVYKMRDRKSVV